MKVAIPLTLSFLLISGGLAQDAKDDNALIQGTWKVESSKDGGKDDPATQGLLLTFKDGKLSIQHGDKLVHGTYKLDAKKNPKWIDIMLDKATFLGIYELKGDTLRVCHGKPNDERSTEFASQVDSRNRVLTILKRTKK
jgi:uncharacterized protein (TIGR03067 family)